MLKLNNKNNIFNFKYSLYLFLINSVKKLRISIKNTGGRNKKGQLVFYRNNRTKFKKIYTYIDFWRYINSYGYIIFIKYDSRRSAHINLICYINGTITYSIAVENTVIGNRIFSGPKFDIVNNYINNTSNFSNKEIDNKIVIGNTISLENIPVGTRISLIETKKNSGAQICRAAGTFAVVYKKEIIMNHNLNDNVNNPNLKNITIKLLSGKKITLYGVCLATVGIVSNGLHKYKLLKKAGVSRNLGNRPVIRGVAMNAIDHPHGGGRGKSSIGKKPLSPWGKLTKWVKTKKKNKRKK